MMNPGSSNWTGWNWDNKRQRRWRARRDMQGNLEYDYYRETGNVDELVSSFNSMNFSAYQEAHSPHSSAYTYDGLSGIDGAAVATTVYNQPSVPTYSPSRAPARANLADPHGQSKGKERETGASKQNRLRPPSKDVGNQNAEDSVIPREPFYNRKKSTDLVQDHGTIQNARPNPPTPGPSPQDEVYSTTYPLNRGAETPHGQAETIDEAASSSPGQHVRDRHGSGFETETTLRCDTTADLTATGESGNHLSMAQNPDEADESKEQLSRAVSQSNPYLTGDVESFYTAGGLPPDHPTQQHIPEIIVPRAYPYQGSVVNIDGNDKESERSDIRHLFVVEHSSRFQPGEVFKILWCEPRGAGPPRSEMMSHPGLIEHNETSFFQGYRRFIVVANDEGHCTCVPILTYEGQGCTKRGVKASKHGIVYQSGKKPRMLPGEPQLGFSPVRVRLQPSEKLKKESRVNYAKLTTIEHNFRVFFIGSVEPDDFRNIVKPAVQTCWERKKRG
ncbi:hypothetical protein VTH06DRAFT_6649 [Thermothelomyces fergusii]